jgi:AcrR family transcriptional regulator
LGIKTALAETKASAVDFSSLREYERLKPGPSQSQLDVIASQRARLQRAIIEIAARDGLDAVTVRRLTKLAGVSTATFYARFSGTDDCMLTTYEEIMAGVARSVMAARSPQLESGEQLDRAVRALLGSVLADRDVARFVLVEVYDGGPAALTVIGEREEALASALRGCLDRRGRRIQKVTVDAILAAILHCARVPLIDAGPMEAEATIDALVAWATDVVEDREELSIPTAGLRPTTMDVIWPAEASSPLDRDEKDLIEAAILRLALPRGFRGLDQSTVSSASGLPTARFRRHFATLADGYLAAIRRTSASFFAELTAQKGSEPSGRAWILAALHKASSRAASDPAAAHLTFRQVIEPGVAGLTCREALISELALACSEDTAVDTTPSMRVRAEARVAALWEALAQGAQATAVRSR